MITKHVLFSAAWVEILSHAE